MARAREPSEVIGIHTAPSTTSAMHRGSSIDPSSVDTTTLVA
jgi:hypothetical protein